METGKVIALRRPRVLVHGPADPAAADRLRRAIVADLAVLAVELAAEGRLPPATPPVKSSPGTG